MGRKAQGGGDNFLRAWREKADLTQEQLAEKVGTTGAVVSLLESGKRPLSDKWLRKFAPVLGTTAGMLLDHHPDDGDTAFMRAALDVPADRRPQALVILKSFKGS